MRIEDIMRVLDDGYDVGKLHTEFNALNSAIRPGRKAGLSPAGRINGAATPTTDNGQAASERAPRTPLNGNNARRRAST
ncbi:MAG: hypothetical protein HRU13_11135 [Phycisphaerales bacterium]|nr:hypothetical protein [Phycisphaerales bacterium]